MQRYFEEPMNGEFLLYSDRLRDKRPLPHYSEPRILVQQIFWNRLAASLSPPPSGPVLYLNSLFSLTRPKSPFTLAALVCILNSRIYSACYERFANRLFGDKFPKVSKVDLARLPVPNLGSTELRELSERGVTLTNLWTELRSLLMAFRESCSTIDSSGGLWNRLQGFWVLDRTTVFETHAAVDSKAGLAVRTAFVQSWQEARDAVQNTWAEICDSETHTERILERALNFSPEVYEQLLAKVPEAKIEDALLPIL